MDSGVSSSNRLGEFLRARRDLITPRQAGLPEYGERRVAGLRREEVALLAGVSTDYYTRLEQGRERHPSEQVMDAIAAALRLDAHESRYLFRLARPEPRAAETVSPRTPGRALLRLMDAHLDAPAVLTGPALDILAANRLAETLYSGFARMDNLLRMIFLDPAALDFYVDWDRAARGVVSNFRAGSAAFADDPSVTAVVGELTVRSPAFSAIWVRREARPRTQEHKALRHPQLGEVRLDYQSFAVTDAPGQQLFVYTADPAGPDPDALARLGRLAAVR
ncbi:helix-turn-helix domain-containing protein [Streptacidiphilus sp. PB12-B1b]|uniref:helix-turn-helix domain-containing protein n=1 Tax=Streptacidiphilus sp. PB12-B1b TaxID=2705012 RepID=UPI0015FA0988|nr:helix-turn-helix transcriptional regulator [Streptacidiphilus sp. PB12-B1b]QMU74658.1 helix-turn-helix domain-containing protein [Streptacidiphilus sp. PB12-B1b]